MKLTHTLWIATLVTISLGTATIAQSQEKTTPAPEQARQGRRDRTPHISTTSLTYLKGAMNLDSDQLAKIKEIQTQLKKDVAPTTPPTPPDPVKLKDTIQKADEAILALLKPEQKAMVAQILKEGEMMRAVGMQSAMIVILKLTTEQKKQIAQIGEALQKDMRALPREDRRTKGVELRTKAHDDALKLLTDDQKKTLEQYEKEHPRRPNPQPTKP